MNIYTVDHKRIRESFQSKDIDHNMKWNIELRISTIFSRDIYWNIASLGILKTNNLLGAICFWFPARVALFSVWGLICFTYHAEIKNKSSFLIGSGGGDICLLTLFSWLSISIASYCVFLLLNEGTRGRELVRESWAVALFCNGCSAGALW